MLVDSPPLSSHSVYIPHKANTSDSDMTDIQSTKDRAEKLIISKPKLPVICPEGPLISKPKQPLICPAHLFYARPAAVLSPKRKPLMKEEETIPSNEKVDRPQTWTLTMSKKKSRRKRTKTFEANDAYGVNIISDQMDKIESEKSQTLDEAPVCFTLPGAVPLSNSVNSEHYHLSPKPIYTSGVDQLSVGYRARTLHMDEENEDDTQNALSQTDFDELPKLRGLWTPTFYCQPRAKIKSPKMRYGWKDENDLEYALKQLEKYNVNWVVNYLKENHSCPDEPRDPYCDHKAVTYHLNAIKSIHPSMHLQDIMDILTKRVEKGI